MRFQKRHLFLANLFYKLDNLFGKRYRTETKTNFPSDINIVIFEPYLIGDSILLLESLKLFKKCYPFIRISVVCNPANIELLSSVFNSIDYIGLELPWINKGWKVKRTIDQLLYIRKRKFDVVFEIRGDLRCAMVAKLFNSTILVSNTDLPIKNFAHIIYPINNQHIFSKYESFLSYFNVQVIEDSINQNFSIFLNDIVGVHFGASMSLRKMPINEIIDIINVLLETHKRIYFCTDPGLSHSDFLLIHNIFSGSGKVMFCSFNLLDFACFVKKEIDLMYCLDSGVAHLVSFLGKKSVVFYASSDYRYTKPLFNSVPIYTENYSNYLINEVSNIESLNNPNNLNLAPKFEDNSMYLGISLVLKKLILKICKS